MSVGNDCMMMLVLFLLLSVGVGGIRFRESRSLVSSLGVTKAKICPKSILSGYCSGHGECNEEKNCVCHEGWGKADCSLNENALRLVTFVTSDAKGKPLCDDLPVEVLEACHKATDEGECAPYRLSSATVCKSICPIITGHMTCDSTSRNKVCHDSEGIPCFGICDAMVEWYCSKHVKKERKAKEAKEEARKKDPMGGGPPSDEGEEEDGGEK